LKLKTTSLDWAKNNQFDPLYFQPVQLLYSKPDDIEIWGEAFTPFKLRLIQIWHKSNGGFEKNNWLNQKFRGFAMEIILLTPLQPPLTSNPRSSRTEIPIELNFGEGLFTPSKLKLIQVWHKSNGGFVSNN
jgi:hypothetical protein